jgi:hypothetical protein
MFTVPKLVIPSEVYQKVMHWVLMAKTFEVSGFGTLEHDAKTNTFTVCDAILLKQTNTGTETEIAAEASGKALYDLRNAKGTMHWHWHSHNSMPVFWSATDEDLIKGLGKNGYIVATVFNNKYEMKSAFCAKAVTPVSETLIFEKDIKTEIISFFSNEIINAWESDYHRLVTERKYEPPVTRNWEQTWYPSDKPLTTTPNASTVIKTPSSSLLDMYFDRQSIHFIKDNRFKWVNEYWEKETQSWMGGYWDIKPKFAENSEKIWDEKEAQIEAYHERLTAKQAKVDKDTENKLQVGLI